MKDKKPFDFWLFITVLMLLSLGLIMVFSASAPIAEKEFNDIYFIIRKQLKYAFIGFAIMLLAANFDYHKYGKKTALLIMGSCIILLALVLVPGIGVEINGSRRWIYFGPLPFQPSELAKLALIIFMSFYLSRRKKGLESFWRDLMPYLLLVGMVAALLLMETHLSATVIIIALSMIILFAAGARIWHFIIIGLPVAGGLAVIIKYTSYMTARINSFLDPWSYPKTEGYQTIQSLYAIGSGGLFGRGLGNSLQKFLYLPYPYNDYIFSILAEELGYVGVVTVLLLFMIFIWRGIKIAVHAPDTYGSLIAAGITALIAVQSLFNVAVVTNSVPPTGVSLPFFSSGGTSLLFFLAEAGILLNISRYAGYERI